MRCLQNISDFYDVLKKEDSDYILCYMLQMREDHLSHLTGLGEKIGQDPDFLGRLVKKLSTFTRSLPYICGLLDNYYDNFQYALFAEGIPDPLMARLDNIEKRGTFFVDRVTVLISKLAERKDTNITMQKYEKHLVPVIQKTDPVKWPSILKLLRSFRDQKYLLDVALRELQNGTGNQYFAEITYDIVESRRAGSIDVPTLINKLLDIAAISVERSLVIIVTLICKMVTESLSQVDTEQVMKRLLEITFW